MSAHQQPVRRSWLFIPGDSERKIAKAAECGADVVIFDLEDAVAPARKQAARELTATYLAEHSNNPSGPELWVRINPLDSCMAEDDLEAVMAHAPAGIVQPKPDGPECVRRLSALLDAQEQAHGINLGNTPILPIATETPIAPFRLGDYAAAEVPRLAGLSWGAEDLSAALGASTNRGPDGHWAHTYQLVRSLTLMAAHAAGVQAVETLHADFRDLDGLLASSRTARCEGFSGRLAIHPAQVEPINAGFTPNPEEVAEAQIIIAAFADAGNVGTVGIDGKMYDRPHLRAAENVLALACAAER